PKQIIKNKDNTIIITEANSNYRKHTMKDYLYYIYVYEKNPIYTKHSDIIRNTPYRIKIEPNSSEITIFYHSTDNYNRIKKLETQKTNKAVKEKQDYIKQGKENINEI